MRVFAARLMCGFAAVSIPMGAVVSAAAPPLSSAPTTPSPGWSADLAGVTARTANDVWAVGRYSTDTIMNRPLSMHWDGSSWRVVRTPTGSGDAQLMDVAALSADDVWAVGYSKPTAARPQPLASQTLVMHWDGVKWRVARSPNPGRNENYLYSVTVIPGTRELWAVGLYGGSGEPQPLILRWDGVGWRQVPADIGGAFIHQVVAVSADDAWAVGTWRPYGMWGQPLVLHWDGVRWARSATPLPGTREHSLSGVVATSSSDVWAVGSYEAAEGAELRPLVLHWDGRSWQLESPPRTAPVNAVGLVAATPLELWTLGFQASARATDGSFLFQRRIFGNWLVTPAPDPGQGAALADAASVGTQIWAVGRVGYQSGTRGGGRTLVLHYDGLSWQTM